MEERLTVAIKKQRRHPSWRSQAISAKAIIVKIATSAAVARISLVFQTWPAGSVTCPLCVERT
jgi:hypothetical protein